MLEKQRTMHVQKPVFTKDFPHLMELPELKNIARKYIQLHEKGEYMSVDKHYHIQHGTGASVVRTYDDTLSDIVSLQENLGHSLLEREDYIIHHADKKTVKRFIEEMEGQIGIGPILPSMDLLCNKFKRFFDENPSMYVLSLARLTLEIDS